MRRFASVAAGAAVLVLLLTSCSVSYPVWVRLESDGSLSVAGCYDLASITRAELELTNAVAGDAKSFEENEIVFTGETVDLPAGTSLSFPLIAAGWQSDRDYWELADWHDARFSITGSDGGLYSDTFGRSELIEQKWVRIGSDRLDCESPE